MLLAARDKVLRKVGKDSLGKLVAYSSDQTHSSIVKACKVCKSLSFFFLSRDGRNLTGTHEQRFSYLLFVADSRYS